METNSQKIQAARDSMAKGCGSQQGPQSQDYATQQRERQWQGNSGLF